MDDKIPDHLPDNIADGIEERDLEQVLMEAVMDYVERNGGSASFETIIASLEVVKARWIRSALSDIDPEQV